MTINKVPKTQRVFLALFAFACFISGNVNAQPLEDINFQSGSDRVIATITLSDQVHYLRHFPAQTGTTLEIFFDKLNFGSSGANWRDHEVRKSPPSDLIPSFTVMTDLRNMQPKLVITFSRPAAYLVSAGKDGRSIELAIKIDRTPPEIVAGLPYLPEAKPWLPAKTLPSSAPAETAPDINQQAAALMLLGRNALAASDNFTAIEVFNKLLLLPPNNYTQDGQEWVGVARERAGQTDNAKLEYDLYLKLYTTGEDASRVKTRLARLGSKPAQVTVTAAERAQKKPIQQTLTYGSLSMHYYHGANKVDKVELFNELIPSSSSAVDQSALLNSVDLTGRFISEEYDNRIVFRDTAYANFLPGKAGKNKLNAAYFEVKNRLSDHTARFGRQSSSGAGVMGRFDGASAGFGVSPSLRVNAVAGQLSDFTQGSKPVFYGASMDMGAITLYAINQTIEGVLDRRAVGTEIRYFEPTKTAFALLDYDTSYSALNTAMVQGTLSPSPERTYTLLLDHRRAPYMRTGNALYGATTTSVEELMQTIKITENDLRALAIARTGASNLAQFGITQQMSQKWQLGGDLRVSNYEGLPSSGITDPNDLSGKTPSITGLMPATPGSTGNEWAVSPQLIGSNLFSSRDVTVFSLSYLASPLYKGQAFYIYSRAMLTDKWSLDAALQYYRQNYTFVIPPGMSGRKLMNRIMPMLRTAYQLKQTLSFDLEAGLEKSHTEQFDQSSDDVQRQFFSVGLRWDF